MPQLTAQDFAETINGRTYPLRITKEEAAQAKAAGLVVVYGASDDLMEFEGAISDELGAYEGTTASVSPAGGIVCDWESLDKDDESEVMRYFENKRSAREIQAIWCPDEPAGASWAYQTDIPHATFDVIEDGEIYCRGIVFSVADLAQAAPAAVAEPSDPDNLLSAWDAYAGNDHDAVHPMFAAGFKAAQQAAALAAAQPVAQEAVADVTPEMLRAGQMTECGGWVCAKLSGGYSLLTDLYVAMHSAAPKGAPPALVGLSDERLAEVLTEAYGSPEWSMDDVRTARAIQRALAAANGMTLREGGNG